MSGGFQRDAVGFEPLSCIRRLLNNYQCSKAWLRTKLLIVSPVSSLDEVCLVSKVKDVRFVCYYITIGCKNVEV